MKLLTHGCSPTCGGFKKPLLFSVRAKKRDGSKVAMLDPNNIKVSIKEFVRVNSRRCAKNCARLTKEVKKVIQAQDTASHRSQRARMSSEHQAEIRIIDAKRHVAHRANMTEDRATRF